MAYEYLTARRFRQRMESIIVKFTEMQCDLNRERKTMVRLWTKRDEQLRCVLESSARLYGTCKASQAWLCLRSEALAH
ncbi:DUF2130 domain-containing protein [Tardiphaga sp. 619_E2_N8_5]|uniref:DUF2130 domain-containing protein n=1 Tax=unclassified Tardiphaga TaxID=2631404 RepID=UPI003F29F3DC